MVNQNVIILVEGENIQEVRNVLSDLSPDCKFDTKLSCLGITVTLEQLDAPYWQSDFPEFLDIKTMRIEIGVTAHSRLEIALGAIGVGLSQIISLRLSVNTALFVNDFDDLLCEHHSGRFINRNIDENLPTTF